MSLYIYVTFVVQVCLLVQSKFLNFVLIERDLRATDWVGHNWLFLPRKKPDHCVLKYHKFIDWC